MTAESAMPHTLRRSCRLAMAFVLAAAAQTGAAWAQTPAEFYKGKTINLFVAVSPGGIYSTFGMILAEHMQKHVPGNPSIVVQHKPGAGGSVAVAYVYNVAPKDGTAVITPNSGIALRIVLGIDKAVYDPSKFTWIGGWGEAVSVLSLRKEITPVRSLQEAKEKEVILGAIGKSSFPYLVPAMINNTLGTKFKIITGYRGGSQIRLAIEKGEVQGWSGQWEGWKIGRPDWVRDDKLVHLVQLASKPSPDLRDVPQLSAFARNAEEKRMFSLVQTGIADRGMAVPPGVPEDRVAALREAYQKTLRDPDFVKDAAARTFEIDPIPGEEIQKYISDVMNSTTEEIARMKKAMGLE
ncbi:MAG: Bug family tripartite tricarboxylate transporter substrate binding protein [Hyphomicrobiaceae bacterium]